MAPLDPDFSRCRRRRRCRIVRSLLHQILHQILVFEESPIEELRYRIIAGVQYYDDIWMFLNMSRAVFKHADVLPKWYYGDPRSREKYEWF